jgi:hypothetical protein
VHLRDEQLRGRTQPTEVFGPRRRQPVATSS